MKTLKLAFAITALIVSTNTNAALIGDEGINTTINSGLGGPYRVQGEVLIGSSWWEDGYILQGVSIHYLGYESARLYGGGFGGCETGMVCQLTETGNLTHPDTGELSPLVVQGFMIKKQDNSNFTLTSLSVLPNGFDPHIEGSGVDNTQLFIGESFDRYSPLTESMDTYSLGALYEPRIYRDFSFGSTYEDVNELFVFTSTDANWSELVLNDVSVSTVPVPAAVWLFGSGLIGLIGLAQRKKT